jgi:hypothetical protein
MPPLVTMLKSYGPDLPYAVRFVRSYERHLSDDIPLVVVVPRDDLVAFRGALGAGHEFVVEEEFARHLVDRTIHGNSAGYMNQQIIKLAFAELGLAANYLCADSDAVLVRPFGIGDFMADTTTPFTFLTEDAELQVEPQYFREYWAARDRMLVGLREYLGLPGHPYATCHNMAVFSGVVLASLRDFLSDRDLTYADALEICPYEFSWYNFWLERHGGIPRIVREPIFKMIHSSSQHLEYVLKGVSIEDIARGYVGLIVNSGYSRQFGLVDFDEPRYRALGQYMSHGELGRAFVLRCTRKAPRVQRWLGLSRSG